MNYTEILIPFAGGLTWYVHLWNADHGARVGKRCGQQDEVLA